MCAPMIAYGVMTAVAAGVTAYSQYSSSRASAAIASANAENENVKAAYAEAAGGAEAGRIRQQGSQVASQQKAALAANGVDVSAGTPLNLFSTTRALSEQDALQAKTNGALTAWGHRSAAASEQAQAQVYRANSVLGPLSTVIGAGSSIAGMYARTK